MSDEKLKEAFKKIKQDIDFIYSEITKLKDLKRDFSKIVKEVTEIKRTLEELKNPTQKLQIPTFPTRIPTLQQPKEAFKPQNLTISTGNDGVPTNQQTIQQTIQHPPISPDKFALIKEANLQENKELSPIKKPDRISKLQQASQILASLDELKKEVRSKFKKLTNQEMLIFSTIYQLEELGIEITYDLLSEKSGLSEISIRDYIRKIINKGIPIDKIKTTNNKVLLSISKDLKKIASLNTILQLREL